MNWFKNLVNEIVWRVLYFKIRPYIIYARVYDASLCVSYEGGGGCVAKNCQPESLRVYKRFFTKLGAKIFMQSTRKCVTQMLKRTSPDGVDFL